MKGIEKLLYELRAELDINPQGAVDLSEIVSDLEEITKSEHSIAISHLVQSIAEKYSERFERYAKDVTSETGAYLNNEGIPSGYRTAMMIYAHQLAIMRLETFLIIEGIRDESCNKGS